MTQLCKHVHLGIIHNQSRSQFVRSFFVGSCLHKESGFPDRSKEPGLKNPYKLWWAKEITPDFHVSGRLTERQMKYAADVGFRSIISLWKYDQPGQFGSDYLPSTKEAKKIVEDVCKMQFASVLGKEDTWCSVDAVHALSAATQNLQKPVLLQSSRGHAVSFVLLMFLASLSRQDPGFRPKIDSKRFYDIACRMGLDFTADTAKEVVAQVTGDDVVKDPPVPNATPASWTGYWMGHPVYKNWFTAGQITRSTAQVLENVGFKSVINLRAGLVLNGFPSQEEVNLVNIQGKTGTYSKDWQVSRQTKARLEETRVDPSRHNSYIGPESQTNYENTNDNEFGDSVGYNAATEDEFFDARSSALDYHHFPVGVAGPYEPFFDKHLDTFVEIGTRGPVLIHCAKAFRASYIAILSAAIQHDLDLDWALEKSRDLGYAISMDTTPEIYKTMEKHLVTRRKIKS